MKMLLRIYHLFPSNLNLRKLITNTKLFHFDNFLTQYMYIVIFLLKEFIHKVYKQGPQKLKSPKPLKFKTIPPIPGILKPYNHHKWLPYQFLGGKIVKIVQIDPQIMLIWSKDLNVTLSVSEGVSGSVIDTQVRKKN